MASAQTIDVTGHAGREPGQGPFLRLRLTVCDSRITAAAFETYACPACQTCGETLCRLLRDLPVASAGQLDRIALERSVGALPRAKQQCLELAMEALEDALENLCSSTAGSGE